MLTKERTIEKIYREAISNMSHPLIASLNAAYEAGAKDMRERCAKVCDEHVTDAMSKQNDTDSLHEMFIRHHAAAGVRLAQAIKALETT
jgi:methylmalonyl-CoA mutase cobalamin-binding subunit